MRLCSLAICSAKQQRSELPRTQSAATRTPAVNDSSTVRSLSAKVGCPLQGVGQSPVTLTLSLLETSGYEIGCTLASSTPNWYYEFRLCHSRGSALMAQFKLEKCTVCTRCTFQVHTTRRRISVYAGNRDTLCPVSLSCTPTLRHEVTWHHERINSFP
jgi:hypothetical protein